MSAGSRPPGRLPADKQQGQAQGGGQSPARAMDGQSFYEACGAEEAPGDAALCEGYLEGVVAAGHAEMIYLRSGCSTAKCRVDTDDLGRGALAGQEWCLPETSSPAARLETVIALLEDRPFERQTQPAPRLIAEALAGAWPCAE